ncbi:hypothetical protein [Tessaracoccus caeni]|uniref:hypothetical protein n=1 Tax=Tessaracoccus caeni TaxID=3031239 RepID=UPI0023DA585B|nr:hypothetical protein [Tessaracoccus caeni]MDF1489229.1 hypothetical protein [Tessaracoccus caeni]
MEATVSEQEVAAWVEQLVGEEDRESLARLLSEPVGTLPEWAWALALDAVEGRADWATVAWVRFRKGERWDFAAGHMIYDDFEALQALYDAAATDEERFAALEESGWAVDLVESNDAEQVLDWLHTREFENRSWRARYLGKLLEHGYPGAERIPISDADLQEYATQISPLIRSGNTESALTRKAADEGLCGVILTERALWDGRDDIRWRLAAFLPASEWLALTRWFDEALSGTDRG